ncbi:MAG: hypothetical protein LIO99_06815 [Clostridiales bacterium]|nr:hypothetical protein [Clostridiales bacterium]
MGCTLVVVLGHTCCGAVGAAIAGNASGYVKSITDKIAAVIHSEADPCKASILNIRNTVSCIRTAFDENEGMAKAEIVGALYDMKSGEVTFLK